MSSDHQKPQPVPPESGSSAPLLLDLVPGPNSWSLLHMQFRVRAHLGQKGLDALEHKDENTGIFPIDVIHYLETHIVGNRKERSI